MTVTGLVLAAGAGRRWGAPKALLMRSSGAPLLRTTVEALADGGCEGVTVVLGAAAERARRYAGSARVVHAANWAEGMGASLRAGLDALAGTPATAVLVSLVDLPDVDAAVVRRVIVGVGVGADRLGRAVYRGAPGHPVLLGREHWRPLARQLRAERGAHAYLRAHAAVPVECADLATGADVDTPRPDSGLRLAGPHDA